MSKDPAFLFYSSDFMTGTFTMTNEQVGKYIRLLCLQHQKGELSEKDMIAICGSFDDEIYSKFDKTDTGKYINRRLFDEIEKRKKHSEKQADNIKKRWSNKNGNTKRIPNKYQKDTKRIPLENENENENVIENINENVIDFTKKQNFAEFVTMTGIEHGKLLDEFGEEVTAKLIDKLNTYKGSNGKKYKSDYMAIRQWVVEAVLGKSKIDSNGLKRETNDLLRDTFATIGRMSREVPGGR